MRTPLSIILITLAFVACSNPHQYDVIAAATLLPSTNVEAAKVSPPEPGTHEAFFLSKPLGKKFTVRWSIYTNGFHTNGFMILESFGVKDGTIYRLGEMSAEQYIALVNNRLVYAPTGGAIQDPGELRDWFRTAEALVCASYGDGNVSVKEVTDEAVFAAGLLMFGRQFGEASRGLLK